MKKLLGILGGMGPLASAEFLKTIYEYGISDLEQRSPACILYSDPTFPDRTQTIVNGEEAQFTSALVNALDKLVQLGASKIVIVCITSHHLLPHLPPYLRDKILCLVGLIIEEVGRAQKRHLLLCTSGARQARVFESHRNWHSVEKLVMLPDDEDQRAIHGIIYRMKQNRLDDAIVEALEALRRKYRAEALIAGCTEFHLLSKFLIKRELQPHMITDPLLILAQNYQGLFNSVGCGGQTWAAQSGRKCSTETE